MSICQNFKHIASRSKRLRANLDALYNKVSCNKCDSCLAQNRNDWYVRARFEMMQTLGLDYYNNVVADPGFILFPCLTYIPTNRPTLELLDDNSLPYYFEGFSYSHIKRFLVELADKFQNRYHTGTSCGVRYMVASEYGYAEEYLDDFGHSRIGQAAPHYHVLLFFPSVAYNDKDYWADVVESLWSVTHRHGRVGWSKKHGKFVTSPLAIKYTTQYCHKQHSYYQRPEIEKWLYQDITKDTPFHVQHELIKEREKQIHDILPFHRESLHFGECAVDFLKSLSSEERIKLLSNGITFPDDFAADGTLNHYILPKYIYDKLYFVIENKSVIEDGKSVVKPFVRYGSDYALADYRTLFRYNFNKSRFDLERITSNLFLSQLDKELIEKLNKRDYVLQYNYADFRHFIDDIKSRYTFDRILSYKHIVHHLFAFDPLSYSDDDLYNFVEDISVNKILTKRFSSLDKYELSIYQKLFSSYNSPDISYLDGYSCVRNDELDEFLSIIDTIKLHASVHRKKAYDLVCLQKQAHKYRNLSKYIL
ncbi:replication initiator protein [Capybara microvirus Cap1_SP_94]|nr:replication initiator protein [Capybara microvirus Cap1_SP_94]